MNDEEIQYFINTTILDFCRCYAEVIKSVGDDVALFLGAVNDNCLNLEYFSPSTNRQIKLNINTNGFNFDDFDFIDEKDEINIGVNTIAQAIYIMSFLQFYTQLNMYPNKLLLEKQDAKH